MKKINGYIASIMGAVLFLTACSGSLEVTPVEKLIVEYGEKLDNSKLFDAKKSDENVSVSKVDGFDAKKLDDQELIVIFTDGNKEKEEKITVTVKDTKAPVIELKEETITITEGDELKLQDNIKSVKDVVDGDLKYSEKKIEKDGYYVDKGKLNVKKAGTYEIKIVAIDKNGNKTEKKFTVKVEKTEDRKTASKGSNSSSNFSNKGNSGSSSKSSSNSSSTSSSKPSNSGSSNKPSSSGSSAFSSKPSGNNGSNSGSSNRPSKPHQHSIIVTGHPDVYYSNMWFNSLGEADVWANDYWGPDNNWTSYRYSAKQCSCGMWSVYFFNISYME